MRSFRDIRVLPVVLVAIFGLVVLKVAGLLIDGGYVFDYDTQPSKPSSIQQSSRAQPSEQSSPQSWAQRTINFPGSKPSPGRPKIDPVEVTGSLHGGEEKKKEEAPKPAAPATEPPKPDGVVVYPDQTPQVSASERAILERLQSRRQELEQRARELEIRESLLKAAEKRIETKVDEAKASEAKITAATAQKTEVDAARFKGIITMYENMKPKDAAKVFDRLEMPVLYEIASQIAPRKMSDILGQMQPEAAERLTVELARRANPDRSQQVELPKIEGKMLSSKPE